MPIRTCIGCRRTDEQRNLVRVVLEPSGRAKVDRERREKGRGAYLHGTKECVMKAVQGGGFPRSFRRKTQPLDGSALWGQIEGGGSGDGQRS